MSPDFIPGNYMSCGNRLIEQMRTNLFHRDEVLIDEKRADSLVKTIEAENLSNKDVDFYKSMLQFGLGKTKVIKK